MNKIEEGIAAIDTAVETVKSGYLPLSGGTITGDITIIGTNGQYGLKIVNGDIYFLTDGGSTILNIIGGITSEKGTSAYHAMSQKGVADNYIAKTDISNVKGADATKVPSLQCLNDEYVPKSGGIINGTIGITGDIEILGNDTLKLSTDGSITFPERASRLTGIADDKGTSSTLAVSQKCLNDNYIAKSELPSNLLKYQIITSTSQIGTDTNTAYLILE